MNRIVLSGCRSDNLSGYLKALGVLRLCAQQADPAARGEWSGVTFVLHTFLDERRLRDFFLDVYRPTPVLNPWNSGAGFDLASRATQGQYFEELRKSADDRFSGYRSALNVAESVLKAAEQTPQEDKTARKRSILEALRREYADDAIDWLDAAVILGRDRSKFAFPPILGTGGNDGRLDFAVNFAARIVDAIGPSRDRAESSCLLHDAFEGSNAGKLLADRAIGQYAPASAGGVNATTGFEAQSLVNPWDFILLIEGAMCFAAAAARRFPGSLDHPIAPFTFRSVVTAGYASVSRSEKVRGELWLPRWSGAASFDAIRSMLRAGRLEISVASGDKSAVRFAVTALEAAHAALAFGTAHGIERFQRVLVAERNGRAFAATSIGTVAANEDRGFADLSRDAIRWVGRLRPDSLGHAGREAWRTYAEAVLAYGNSPQGRRARSLQDVIAALGELDRTLAAAPPKELSPLPFLPATLMRHLDDGSPEHELARAVCSIGMGSLEFRFRFNVANVSLTAERRLMYARTPDVLWVPRNLVVSLSAIADRRARLVEVQGQDRTPLACRAGGGASIETLARFVEDSVDSARLERLIVGYSIIEPSVITTEHGAGKPFPPRVLPVALAALKIVVDGVPAAPEMQRPPLDATIIALLRAKRTSPALERLYRRLYTSGFDSRDFRKAVVDGPLYAAAALFPLTQSAQTSARRTMSRSTPGTAKEN